MKDLILITKIIYGYFIAKYIIYLKLLKLYNNQDQIFSEIVIKILFVFAECF